MSEEQKILKGNAAKLFIGKVSGIPAQEIKDIEKHFAEHPPSPEERKYFEDNCQIRERIYQCFAQRCSKYVDEGITQERVDEIVMDALSIVLPDAVRLFSQQGSVGEIEDNEVRRAVIAQIPKGAKINDVATQPRNGEELNTFMVAARAKEAISQELFMAWVQALALLQDGSDLIKPADVGRETPPQRADGNKWGDSLGDRTGRGPKG